VGCVDCPEPREPTVQRAVSFRAWYIGGKVYEGGSHDWAKLPDDGVLAVKVFFSDGTARNCNGNDWYGLLVVSPDSWTVVHNNNEDNEKRYPNALWKRGMWTSEEEMNRVAEAMNA
jgi:hypothetical protein